MLSLEQGFQNLQNDEYAFLYQKKSLHFLPNFFLSQNHPYTKKSVVLCVITLYINAFFAVYPYYS